MKLLMLFLVLLAPILLASGCGGAGEGNKKPNINASNVGANVTPPASPTAVINSSPIQSVNSQTNTNANRNGNTNKLNRDDRDERDGRNKNRPVNRNANRRERDEDNDDDRDGRER